MDGCLRGPLARLLSKFRTNPWADWPQKTFCFVFGLSKMKASGRECLVSCATAHRSPGRNLLDLIKHLKQISNCITTLQQDGYKAILMAHKRHRKHGCNRWHPSQTPEHLLSLSCGDMDVKYRWYLRRFNAINTNTFTGNTL